jgi:hypothetical protein
MRESNLGARKSRTAVFIISVLLAFSQWCGAQAILVTGFKGLDAGPGKMVEVPAHGSVLEISNADTTTSVLRSLPLPVASMTGRLVVVRCEVAAENISAKPELWNGIKVMVHIVYPGGEQWPEVNLPVGTFDWRNASVRCQIPPNATAVALILGLEKVTGTVHIAGLSVEADAPFVRAPAAPPNQPIFTGRDVPRFRGAMADPKMTEQDLATFADEWNGNLIRWQLMRD